MQVSEEDMLYGLWRKRCQSEVTRTSLWLLQTGHVETAEELLGGASRMALINGVQVRVLGLWGLGPMRTALRLATPLHRNQLRSGGNDSQRGGWVAAACGRRNPNPNPNLDVRRRCRAARRRCGWTSGWAPAKP